MGAISRLSLNLYVLQVQHKLQHKPPNQSLNLSVLALQIVEQVSLLPYIKLQLRVELHPLVVPFQHIVLKQFLIKRQCACG